MGSELRAHGDASSCWCGQPPTVRFRGLGPWRRDVWRCSRHLIRPGRNYEAEVLP